MPSRPHGLAPPPLPPARQTQKPRPWPALPALMQRQLAQQVALLLQRVREEARHADRVR